MNYKGLSGSGKQRRKARKNIMYLADAIYDNLIDPFDQEARWEYIRTISNPERKLNLVDQLVLVKLEDPNAWSI